MFTTGIIAPWFHLPPSIRIGSSTNGPLMHNNRTEKAYLPVLSSLGKGLEIVRFFLQTDSDLPVINDLLTLQDIAQETHGCLILHPIVSQSLLDQTLHRTILNANDQVIYFPRGQCANNSRKFITPPQMTNND